MTSHLTNSLNGLNFKFEDTPEGEFVETIFAAQGQLERKQNARQTIQKMKARIHARYYCRTKVVGYRYQRFSDHGKMFVPDEPTASIIREAFEGYVSDRLETVADVARFLKRHPTISQATNRQRATNMLRRSLYAGYISIPNWDFHMHPGKHEPLVSLTLWQAAQDKMDGKRNRPARADVHEDFPLRNFVACECCGSALTAGWSKGRTKHYGYYTCQAKRCDLRGKSIRKEKIEDAFGDVVNKLCPSPVLVKTLCAMFKDNWDQRIHHAKVAQQEMLSQVIGLDKKVSTLMKRLVSSTNEDIVKAYETEITKVTHEKRLLQEKADGIIEPQKPFEECFKTALQFFLKPRKLWESGVFEQQRLLLKLAIPEPLTYTREKGFLNPNFTLPFNMLGANDMQNLQMVPHTAPYLRPKHLI